MQLFKRKLHFVFVNARFGHYFKNISLKERYLRKVTMIHLTLLQFLKLPFTGTKETYLLDSFSLNSAQSCILRILRIEFDPI